MCNVIFFHLLFESNKIHCFSKKSFHSHYKNRIYHDNYSSSPPYLSHHEDEQSAWRLHHRAGWRQHELLVLVDADTPDGQLTAVRTNLRALEREPFLLNCIGNCARKKMCM